MPSSMNTKSTKRTGRAKATGLAETSMTSIRSAPEIRETARFGDNKIFELFQKLIDLNIPEVQEITYEILSRMHEYGKSVLEKETRQRSIVVFGLPELEDNMPASIRQEDTEDKVKNILDTLDIECRPVKVYRMGKKVPGKSRLVKIELPTRAHWATVLARSRQLRNKSEFSKVFIRRSMTVEEREKEKELRERARTMNQGKKYEDRFVVYRGEIVPASSLNKPNIAAHTPITKSQGN